MNKEDLFAKMKYRLETSYPQYKFTIKENALVMNNKSPSTFMEAITVPILRYNKETDKMVLSFPKIISPGNNTSSPGKEYISTSIDTYNLDYYNVSENHIDYIVENLLSGVIQKEVTKYESMKKDFE
jgi:hypothetical protein